MRLIDADALKETIAKNVYLVTDFFNSRDYGMFWTGGIEKAIDEQHTVEPERKTGRWVKQYHDSGLVKCSYCGYEYSDYIECDNFCGNCGAKMEV